MNLDVTLHATKATPTYGIMNAPDELEMSLPLLVAESSSGI